MMTNRKSSKPSCTHMCGFLLLPMFIQAANTQTPSTVCTSSDGSTPWWEGPTPLLPTLPQQYSMRVEANIIQNSWTTDVEEHYDSISQRASVSLTRNGSTTVSIFNFKTNQRYDIYPNGTCLIRPNEVDMFGFVTKNKQNRPAMATVNDVFRFGSKFNWTYVAKETVRGIPVNHWTSCQSWVELRARFQLDYYFSDPDYTTASGRAEIPVRAELRGLAHNVDMSSGPINGQHTFQHIYEFTSFLSGPVLNEDVFQVPRGIFCSGRTDRKPFPQIPKQLEMSMEVVRSGSAIYPRYVHLRCDHNNNIQEIITSYVISGSTSLREEEGGPGNQGFGNVVTATGSVIMDYNSNIIYITNLINNACTVHKMRQAMTGMPNNYCLFQVTNQFVYQGQITFRTMQVDVWSMEQNNTTTELYFLPDLGVDLFPIMTGIFIKNKSSASTADLPKILQNLFGSERSPEEDFTSSFLHELLSSTSHSPPARGDYPDWKLQLDINIFNYRPLVQKATNFQISRCFPDFEISEIALFIIANYETEVVSNLLLFSSSLRKVLAEKIGVSILHISNFAMITSTLKTIPQNCTKVTFTLLGSANISQSKQKSVTEIVDVLIKAVSAGITIHVKTSSFSKDFKINREIYFIDNKLRGLSSNINGLKTVSSNDATNVSSHATNVSLHTTNGHTTYTQGTVAGIAIGSFGLGALVCLVITILVQRQGSVNEPLVTRDTD